MYSYLDSHLILTKEMDDTGTKTTKGRLLFMTEIYNVELKSWVGDGMRSSNGDGMRCYYSIKNSLIYSSINW